MALIVVMAGMVVPVYIISHSRLCCEGVALVTVVVTLLVMVRAVVVVVVMVMVGTSGEQNGPFTPVSC